MRDPHRIEPTLKAVEALWRSNPDLRLGQLICNLAYKVTGDQDPFHVEDDKLAHAARQAFRDMG